MSTKKEIMSLLLKGVSWDDVCASARCGKSTVARCAAKIRELGLDEAGLLAMTDAGASALFADGRAARSGEYLEPDYERVCEQLARVPKMTMALQWERYSECNPQGKRPYRYSQFCRKVGDYARTHDLSARIAHEPGRVMLVDRAGGTARLRERATGARRPAHLFVACPPCSGWIYAECLGDMRSGSWVDARVHAFEAMGGVPDIVVPDNCATATDRRGKSEPVKVNDRYLEMAEHYGCAVVPARVRRPRDKALAEKAVDLCETWVLAPLAGEAFSSLGELNAEAFRLVDALNARPFQQRDGSRERAFAEEERAALHPLPPARYEALEWRRCKVSPDHRVQVEYMRRSVPHRLVGRTLDVRMGPDRLEVLDGAEVVASRPGLSGRRGQYSTDPAHMPLAHLEERSP